MSAIGSVVFVKRPEFAHCVQLAAQVRYEKKGWGPFKKDVTYGREAFEQAWRAAVVEAREFDFSGHALTGYFDAQQQLNGVDPERLASTAAGQALDKVFMAAIPFEQPLTLPALSPDSLRAYCAAEYGEDADEMFQIMQAADAFCRSGIQRLSAEHVVVFLVS